jgi:hypothetical protein
LSSGIEGFKKSIIGFTLEWKFLGAFFSSQKKEGGWELQYELRKKITNLNSTEINLHKQKKRQLMQIGAKH